MTATVLATVSNAPALRAALLPWREAGQTVALVPTMGALHRGHMALIAAARKAADKVVASIFVNPTQFGPSEDLSRYPRPLDHDMALLTEAGCDLLYRPDAAAMYPEGFVTGVDPGPLATVLEGAIRPGHFRGVATVVSKLLLQALPDAAVFGEKDFQQLQVIRRVVRDLDLPIHIIGVPTVRDEDGLALSSRNVYLSDSERLAARRLPEVLQQAAQAIGAGGDVAVMLAQGKAQLEAAGFAVDYLTLVDNETLQPRAGLDRPARLLVAARIGTTRLIDNVAVDTAVSTVEIDNN